MPEATAVRERELSAANENVEVLGVRVSAITMAQALLTLDAWIATKEPHYVCVTSVHGIMESQRDEGLRRIHQRAGLVTPDGMPLVWLSRWKGQRHVERVYGPDLMLATCRASLEHGYRHFFYGAGEGVADQLAARLTEMFPGLQVVGTCAPPFRPLTAQEDVDIVERINAASPDIVWVGLSTPKQERWMAEHVGRLSAPVLIGVGAAFDFHAGLKLQAPRFIQRSGLEWLFRLVTEPRRLWRRYLTNNPLFVWRVLVEAVLGPRVAPAAADSSDDALPRLELARVTPGALSVKAGRAEERVRPVRLTADCVVVASSEQVSCDLGGETVILGLRDSNYYGLNGVGTQVWHMIQEVRTIREIREQLIERYDVDSDRCLEDLLDLLGRLADRGLIRVEHATAA